MRRNFRMPAKAAMPTLAMLTLLISAAGLGVGPARAADEPAPLADQAPASDHIWSSKFKDVSGTMQPLEQWKGKTVVVYFWASWCVPCHKETPRLVKLYDRFRDQDVVVIGIALDNADKVRDFVAKYSVDYPVVYGGRDAIQLGRDLGNDQGAIPFTVIIDKSGKIVETIKGDTPDGKLEAILAPLAG